MKSFKEFLVESADDIRDKLSQEQNKNKRQDIIQKLYDKEGMKGIMTLRSSIDRFGRRPRMKSKARSMQKYIDTWETISDLN